MDLPRYHRGGNGGITMISNEKHLKGLYKFSIQTLSWMIRSREMKIKNLKEEIKMIKVRIKEVKNEVKHKKTK